MLVWHIPFNLASTSLSFSIWYLFDIILFSRLFEECNMFRSSSSDSFKSSLSNYLNHSQDHSIRIVSCGQHSLQNYVSAYICGDLEEKRFCFLDFSNLCFLAERSQQSKDPSCSKYCRWVLIVNTVHSISSLYTAMKRLNFRSFGVV